MNGIATRVARGAQWLDRNYPGWWAKIDLETLTVSSCKSCVLGQVYTRMIPANEQDQIFAQVLESGVDKNIFGANGAWGGYNLLYFYHQLEFFVGNLGFALSTYPLFEQETGRPVAGVEEFTLLTDEWTRVILGRRIDAHPDLADLGACRRELVSA